MKKLSGLMGIFIFGVLFVDHGLGQRLTRRRSTSTTTTVAPDNDLAERLETLASREANLLAREESFNKRENIFRERELNFTIREEGLRKREDGISVREENLKIREIKGDDIVVTTPAPDLSLVRFDKTGSGRWLELGSTEFCSENMRFFAVPGSKTDGICDCDYHQCNRPLLYNDVYKQCFWAWSPGPCEQGEWYTYNDTLHPVCAKNKCPPTTTSVKSNRYYFQDPDDNECYETTRQGYCQEEGQTLLHTSDDPFPKCRTHSMCFPLTVPAYQECIAGNRRHIDGFCE